MSKRTEKNKYFLLLYCDCSPSVRRKLFDNTNNSQFMAILECCANVMRGNVPISDKCRAKLYKKREIFRMLSFDKKKSWRVKKDIVKKTQVGGILTALVSAAATYLFDKLINHLSGSSSSKADSGKINDNPGEEENVF